MTRTRGPEQWWGTLERDRMQALWDAMEEATRRAGRSQNELAQPRGEAMEYRNGLLAAWAIVTGEDIETTYEALQAAVQAHHEQQEVQ